MKLFKGAKVVPSKLPLDDKWCLWTSELWSKGYNDRPEEDKIGSLENFHNTGEFLIRFKDIDRYAFRDEFTVLDGQSEPESLPDHREA